MYINISYDEGIQEDSNIEAVIRKVCDEVSRVYGLEEDEMSILLCDNAKIHELNKEYRGIDRPTEPADAGRICPGRRKCGWRS